MGAIITCLAGCIYPGPGLLPASACDRVDLAPCSRSYLENQMAVALGGRVAEELIFGEDDVTTGASGDFQQVLSATAPFL